MHKLFCDFCKKEVPILHGKYAIGKVEIDGKIVEVLDSCPECRKKFIDTFGIKVFEEPETKE